MIEKFLSSSQLLSKSLVMSGADEVIFSKLIRFKTVILELLTIDLSINNFAATCRALDAEIKISYS